MECIFLGQCYSGLLLESFKFPGELSHLNFGLIQVQITTQRLILFACGVWSCSGITMNGPFTEMAPSRCCSFDASLANVGLAVYIFRERTQSRCQSFSEFFFIFYRVRLISNWRIWKSYLQSSLIILVLSVSVGCGLVWRRLSKVSWSFWIWAKRKLNYIPFS